MDGQKEMDSGVAPLEVEQARSRADVQGRRSALRCNEDRRRGQGLLCCGLSLCAVPFYTSVPLYFRGAEQRDKVDGVDKNFKLGGTQVGILVDIQTTVHSG